ncbi:MAG: response regulator [Oscillospiraceae bacterium]|nr:response regulator [Oscillospiraceae bacterium]
MKVGIGYSDDPESGAAGLQAVNMALLQAERAEPCDMVLLFSTSRHDFEALREAAASAAGESVPIYGGGAVGVITNDYFGYAGDQVAAACIWLDGVVCEAFVEGELNKGEEEAGIRLGKRLSDFGTSPSSPVMMFYETFDFSEGFRMLMATWLLQGIEKGLGFVPDLTGAGLMGNHGPAPTKQWLGDGIGEHSAIALAFSGDIRMDSVIMHGCRPATGYYTVTKAAGQAILEINGKPAVQFIDELLDHAVAPEKYPFFLLFGVNHGERWGEYDEDYYASRLCLSIDKESGAIIMFEPDMVEGTEFQIMFRSMELDYIKPKIDRIFDELDGREPVFAVYINCAGRCAGYGGNDMEDALVIRETVAGRVPVLGLYTGVEIASIGGRPRGLDWTGVFCLFSQSKDKKADAGKKASARPVWEPAAKRSDSKEVPAKAMVSLCEQNAARFLALDRSSIAIRYELEQKRRGFSLLSELSVSLRHDVGFENVFALTSKRINSALNMQRTVVLVNDGKGRFRAEILQGYTANEKTKLAGRRIPVPAEMLDPDNAVLITGSDSAERFGELRALLDLPFFISSPVILQGEVYAILLTGRMVEADPYLVRLSRSDMETVHAIGALLASTIAGQRLVAAEERNQIMIEAAPMCCVFWDENGNLSHCNKETLLMFGLPSEADFIREFNNLSPEFQPDGRHSETAVRESILKVFVTGETTKIKWIHKTLGSELIPAEVTLIRVPKGGNYFVAGYMRDLREQEAARKKMNEAQEASERYIKAKNEFLASVSHEIRTPMNAIQAMARIAGEVSDITAGQQNLIKQGMYSIDILTSAIEAILDFSKLDSGQLSLETGEFSLRGLVNEIGETGQKEAAGKSLAFGVSVDPAAPDLFVGDFVRLRQAILNVVMNAVKFTETGGVEINVSHEIIGSGDGALVIFEVRDTGIGITGEQMANIFHPLYSGDSSYSRKYGGLGMGLSVSSSLLTLMGGSITCDSLPGEGSVFRISIPLTAASEKIAEPEEKPGMSYESVLHGLRVLVAEDNNINQMIMEELLVKAGIEVAIANNGLEALEKLKKEDFDIVLMDIQMPEMDGLTATAQIRTDSRNDKLPVIAVTANAGKEHFEESMRAGMNDFLTKPVDTEQLYDILIKWSGRKQ